MHRLWRNTISGFLAITALACVGSGLPFSASASDDALRWTPFNIPAKGENGGWMLANGSDVKCLTSTSSGTLYACVSGLPYTLFRSTDGGRRWSHVANIKDEIIGIAVPPDDTDTLYYATKSLVYRATDGGKTIVRLPPLQVGSGNDQMEITSIDVTRMNSNIIAIGTRDTDSARFGGVYTLEDNTIPAWVDAGIGDYDVCAVAFSPGYAHDGRLIIVMTDEAETFTSVKTGNGGWSSQSLEMNNSEIHAPVIAAAAAVAFPDDYNPRSFSQSCYYIGIDTDTGDGDVYRVDEIAPDVIIPTDLNLAQAYGQDDIDVSGLAVHGNGAGLFLLAGAADSASTFTSTDSGRTWTISQKCPTGARGTITLLPKDSISSGIIFTATSGDNSAISISRDSGTTWNQVAFIDIPIDFILDLAPSPEYKSDKTAFLLTFGEGHSFWRTSDGGENWERVMYRNPDTDSILLASLPRGYSHDNPIIFLVGENDGQPVILKSTDNGQSYCGQFIRDPVTGLPFTIDAWSIAGLSRFFIAGYDGVLAQIYRTDNGGFFYNSGAPVGDQPVESIAISPSYENDHTILAGSSDGNIFLSTDDGLSFQPLPPDTASPYLSGSVQVAFDPLFAKNRIVYAASDTDGVFRFIVNSSRRWENTGGSLPAGSCIRQLFSGDPGTLYTLDTGGNGAIERCLDPSSSSPVFEKLTPGFDEDTTISNLWTSGSRLWALDSLHLTLFTLYDSLTVPVTAIAPENGASGIGDLINHMVKNVILDWDSLEGATAYEWQCSDTDFSSIPEGLQGNTQASNSRLPKLEPATEYHWRVRASSPVQGPWSEKKAFTTCLDTEAAVLQPESPASGASGIPVNPVFKWTALVGATGYELLAAADVDFTSPSIDRTGAFALPTNTWLSDVNLENGVTYYWKVRATGSGSFSAWSSVGVFTTEPADTETADRLEEKEETPLVVTPAADLVPVTPTVTLSITLMTTTTTVSPAISEPGQPPLPISVAAQNPDSSTGLISGLPDWIVYFIGGLLFIIILALTVMLAIVLKTRRFM